MNSVLTETPATFPPPKAPWVAEPYRLVSLWEIVKPFYPTMFTVLTATMDLCGALNPDEPISKKIREMASSNHSFYRPHFVDLGLIASTATLDEMSDLLSKPECTNGELRDLSRELHGRLTDELFNILFFSMTGSEIQYYSKPTKGWEETIKRWPKTRIDIEESSRCFACARYAASIFHVLLVAEIGVIEVAKVFGVAGDKPGWGALDRLEKILVKPYKERSQIQQSNSDLLKQVLPLMLAIKDSWRHKISHVENKLEWLDTDFSPQLAEEIMTATRGFMRRLAAELREPENTMEPHT